MGRARGRSVSAMRTIQALDQRLAARISAARDPLIEGLGRAARGRDWHYLLFGSLARQAARRGSDADIAVVGATGAERREAERAARALCATLGLTADIVMWEDLADRVQLEAQRDGIACGG